MGPVLASGGLDLVDAVFHVEVVISHIRGEVSEHEPNHGPQEQEDIEGPAAVGEDTR